MSLDKGRKNNRLLIQPQYAPMPVGEQVAVLYCGTHALMADIPLEKVSEFEGLFLDRMRSSHKDVLAALSDGKIDADIEAVLTKVAAEVCSQVNV